MNEQQFLEEYVPTDCREEARKKLLKMMVFSQKQQQDIKECLECCEGSELERTLREITGVE